MSAGDRHFSYSVFGIAAYRQTAEGRPRSTRVRRGGMDEVALASASHPGKALAFPLFVYRWNTHRAERLFVSTLITIQTLV